MAGITRALPEWPLYAVLGLFVLVGDGATAMQRFKWTKQKEQAALSLADGKTHQAVADECCVNRTTLWRWIQHPEFSEEVDRLTLMTGIASRAERLRIAKRVVRQRTDGDVAKTDRDLLDWLKFAQSETDGIKLDLTALAEATASLADSGSDRSGDEDEDDGRDDPD